MKIKFTLLFAVATLLLVGIQASNTFAFEITSDPDAFPGFEVVVGTTTGTINPSINTLIIDDEDTEPTSYESGVEGEESLIDENPSSYESGVEGEDSISGDSPAAYQSGVEGEEGPAEEIVTPQEENTSSRGRSGSRRNVTAPVGNLAGGEVLGASTDAGSCKVLTTFMKFGSNNNVEEVKMLQSFLNSKMNAGLPVTGYFGPLTLQAVKNFQAQYSDEILKPWVDAGLMTDATPTGYVYKTTQYAINKMLCPEAELVSPVLN